MGSWGFIGLAYGVGAVALLGYLLLLQGRVREAAAEMTAMAREGERRRR